MSDLEAVSSRREQLAAAFEATETDEAPVESAAPEPAEPPAPAEAEAAEETPAPDAQRAIGRDEKGKFIKPTPSKLAAKPSTKPGTRPGQAFSVPTPGAKASGAQPGSPPVLADAPKLKPPSNWSAAGKETWATLPAAAQAEAVRIDREVRRVMDEVAPIRQRDQAWGQVISPHMQMIQARGGNPMAVVQNFLQTGAVLHSGSPLQKAHLVADIIRDFGIPVEQLAAALDGQPAPQGMQQPAPPRQQDFRDPRVDQMLAQRQEQLGRQGQNDIEEFLGAKEFGDDQELRHAMADLLEMAANRKSPIELEDAYDAAINTRRDLKAILKQREEAAQANAQRASTMRARAASSSIRSQPSGAVGGASQQGASRRELLAKLLDDAG